MTDRERPRQRHLFRRDSADYILSVENWKLLRRMRAASRRHEHGSIKPATSGANVLHGNATKYATW